MQNKTTNDSEWIIALDVPYNLISHSFRNEFRATWHSRAPHESAHISMISSSGSSTQLYSNCASRMSFSRKTRLFSPHFSLKCERKNPTSISPQESSIYLRDGKIRCMQNQSIDFRNAKRSVTFKIWQFKFSKVWSITICWSTISSTSI